MTGFAGREHTPETKARIGAASRGKPTSEETKAKQRAAKLGRRWTPEHRAKIGEAIRRSWAEGGHRDIFTQMSAEQHDDYRILRSKGGFTRAEALALIGRRDLIE